MVVLTSYVPSTYVLMGTSVLSLTRRNSITICVDYRLFMNIFTSHSHWANWVQLLLLLVIMFYFVFYQIFTLIKVSLCSHLIIITISSACNGSFAVSSSSWSSAIWSSHASGIITKSIKIVEHKIHVFLLVLL